MQHNKLLSEHFISYLQRSGLTDQTIKGYRCIVEKFLLEHPGAFLYRYGDILDYLESLNKFQFNAVTKQLKLTAIKKFFDFLIETGQREDHPCKTIYIKTNAKKDIIQADLFSMRELESLLQREERYKKYKLRNQLIISLLIYQGLLPGEIADIKLKHVDLDLAKVYVNSGKQLSARTLPLTQKQVDMINEYLSNDRERLLIKVKHDFLLVSSNGTKTSVDNINTLIESLKPRFPDRNLCTRIIRDSVISYWINVKGIPVEQVQILAGHRYPSSTIRYRQIKIREAREVLNRFFPL